MKKHTYLAISSTNPGQGYQVIAAGNRRNSVADVGKRIANEQGRYSETYNANLKIVSKTAARKEYGIRDWQHHTNDTIYEWVK